MVVSRVQKRTSSVVATLIVAAGVAVSFSAQAQLAPAAPVVQQQVSGISPAAQASIAAAVASNNPAALKAALAQVPPGQQEAALSFAVTRAQAVINQNPTAAPNLTTLFINGAPDGAPRLVSFIVQTQPAQLSRVAQVAGAMSVQAAAMVVAVTNTLAPNLAQATAAAAVAGSQQVGRPIAPAVLISTVASLTPVREAGSAAPVLALNTTGGTPYVLPPSPPSPPLPPLPPVLPPVPAPPPALPAVAPAPPSPPPPAAPAPAPVPDPTPTPPVTPDPTPATPATPVTPDPTPAPVTPPTCTSTSTSGGC